MTWREEAPSARSAESAHAQIRELVLTLRGLEQAHAAAQFLAGLCPEPQRQALGISELLLNAVEHGNLELDSALKAELLQRGEFQAELEQRLQDLRYCAREVSVRFRRFDDFVELTIEDQGNGFDWRAYEQVTLENVVGPSGRGIALARQQAFDSLTYEGRGNVVVARARSRDAVLRRNEPVTSLSYWERRSLELETDGCLERAQSADFFEVVVEHTRSSLQSARGCLLYLNEAGRLVAGRCRTPSGSSSSEPPRIFEAETLGADWRQVLEHHTTLLIETPHVFEPLGTQVRCSLLTPVLHRGQLLGVLHVADRGAGYSPRELQALEVIAQRLAPALATRIVTEAAVDRNHELQSVQERLREEQELARHLLGGLLREGCLDAPGIRYLITAKDLFNGDIALAARLPDGGLRWMLGDFVGHGLPAAIGGLPLGSMFYATCRKGVPLAEVVATMNDSLLANLPRGFFCAAILLDLHAATGRLEAWNGGMPAALLRSASSTDVRQIPSRDLPLGTVPSAELALPIETYLVEPGDRVLCFSDGLLETSSESGELYGPERALRVLSSTGAATQVFDALLASLEAFRGAGFTHDDLSLIEVTVGSFA